MARQSRRSQTSALQCHKASVKLLRNYLFRDTSLQNQDDAIEVTFSYDVIEKRAAILATSVFGQDRTSNEIQNGTEFSTVPTEIVA